MQSIWQQSNLYFMYGKFIIENWILEYSRLKQMQLLKEMLQNTLFLAKFVGAFLLMTFLSILAFVLLQKKGCDDETLCALEPLFKKLAKEGLFKEADETMQHFLERAAHTCTEQADTIAAINTLYHKAKYSAEGDENSVKKLKAAVAQL